MCPFLASIIVLAKKRRKKYSGQLNSPTCAFGNPNIAPPLAKFCIYFYPRACTQENYAQTRYFHQKNIKNRPLTESGVKK